MESCDRIEDEFNKLHLQNVTLSQEIEKVKKEKSDSEKSLKTHREMFALAAKEVLRQKEMVTELHRLVELTFPHLGHDLQEEVTSSLETMRDDVDNKPNATGIPQPFHSPVPQPFHSPIPLDHQRQSPQPSKESTIQINQQKTHINKVKVILNRASTHSNAVCKQTPDQTRLQDMKAIEETNIEEMRQDKQKKRIANGNDDNRTDDQTNSASKNGSSSRTNDETGVRPNKISRTDPEPKKPEAIFESQSRNDPPACWQPMISNPLNIPSRHFTPNETVFPLKEFTASRFGASTKGLDQSDFSLFVDWEGGVEKVDFADEPCKSERYHLQAQPSIILNHMGPVSSMVLHSDNDKQLAFSAGKDLVKIWDVGSKSCATRLEFFKNKFVRTMKFNRLDKTLVMGGEMNQLVVWDMGRSNPTIKYRIQLDTDSCYSMALGSDSRLCITCGDKGNVTAWDLRTQASVRKFQGHAEVVTCIDFSANGSEIWTGGLDGTVRSWDVLDGRQVALFDLHSTVYALDYCPRGDCVAVAAGSSLELLQPTKRGKYVFVRHYKDVTSLKYAKNGEWFVTIGKDGLVNLLRSPKGQTVARMREARVTSCDISDDGQFVGTGSMNGRIAIREVAF